MNRIPSASKALLNAAHLALASLSIPKNLKAIAPNAASFTLITQNVDGLSVQAFHHLSPSPRNSEPHVIEMHGHIFDTLCSLCDDRQTNRDSPICAALAGTETNESDIEIPLKALPRCLKCTGLLRPAVVWFGEVPLRLKEIDKIVKKADLALVVGTSSNVRLVIPFDSYISTPSK